MDKRAQLHEAWKEANSTVRAAEERVQQAWTAFAAGQGGPPAKELLEELARLRRECDQRLAAVLDRFTGSKPEARRRGGGAERPSS